MTSEFRSLSEAEIGRLQEQGCTCCDWTSVKVAQGFNPERVRFTHFSGDVEIGVLEKTVTFYGGLKRPAGITGATIHNCKIGSNVYINNIHNYIANYIIGDNAVIDNVNLLAVDGETSFGNGTEVSVLNEAGGREVPIYDNLTAQIAYILALYRHRQKAIENIREMISRYVASVRASRGLVAAGARIINCGSLKNVKIGPDAVIEGAIRMENGTINSCPQDPVYIGSGVFAEDFIACSGSQITDGTIICKCFVGQGTVLAKQYSAENSIYFANCGGFHGEACSVFAGPYTVTHHKSTLLIAGLFSFLNAGSGTNQSNHMYKLGPVHQGVVERGSKTASDSYMLWPAKVGPFTVVMGRHYKNSDTSDLPFSYLIEHEDESILVPGVNLRSVGTVRDARKWPKRDRRKDPTKLDCINFRLLSPYTIQKMLNGAKLLRNLRATSGENTEYFTYNNVRIKKSSLENGIKLYEIGIDKFLGNRLIEHLENKKFASVEELRAVLMPQTRTGTGKWLDLAGLLAPQESVQEILNNVENGTTSTLEQLTESFQLLHDNYSAYEWAWAADAMQQRLGKTIEKITPDDIIELATKWKQAVVELDNRLYTDAKKEFAATAQIGYGLDGEQETKHSDFEAVRGAFEENSFVSEIEKHIIAKTKLCDELISRMEKLRIKS
jgi:hypothetical protein